MTVTSSTSFHLPFSFDDRYKDYSVKASNSNSISKSHPSCTDSTIEETGIKEPRVGEKRKVFSSRNFRILHPQTQSKQTQELPKRIKIEKLSEEPLDLFPDLNSPKSSSKQHKISLGPLDGWETVPSQNELEEMRLLTEAELSALLKKEYGTSMPIVPKAEETVFTSGLSQTSMTSRFSLSQEIQPAIVLTTCTSKIPGFLFTERGKIILDYCEEALKTGEWDVYFSKSRFRTVDIYIEYIGWFLKKYPNSATLIDDFNHLNQILSLFSYKDKTVLGYNHFYNRDYCKKRIAEIRKNVEAMKDK